MLVALTADPARLDGALDAVGAPVRPSSLPTRTGPAGRAAYLRVVTPLMRLTALQLLLAERPDLVPAAVVAAWPTDPADGRRLPVGGLDRVGIAALVGASTSRRC